MGNQRQHIVNLLIGALAIAVLYKFADIGSETVYAPDTNSKLSHRQIVTDENRGERSTDSSESTVRSKKNSGTTPVTNSASLEQDLVEVLKGTRDFSFENPLFLGTDREAFSVTANGVQDIFTYDEDYIYLRYRIDSSNSTINRYSSIPPSANVGDKKSWVTTPGKGRIVSLRYWQKSMINQFIAAPFITDSYSVKRNRNNESEDSAETLSIEYNPNTGISHSDGFVKLNFLKDEKRGPVFEWTMHDQDCLQEVRTMHLGQNTTLKLDFYQDVQSKVCVQQLMTRLSSGKSGHPNFISQRNQIITATAAQPTQNKQTGFNFNSQDQRLQMVQRDHPLTQNGVLNFIKLPNFERPPLMVLSDYLIEGSSIDIRSLPFVTFRPDEEELQHYLAAIKDCKISEAKIRKLLGDIEQEVTLPQSCGSFELGRVMESKEHSHPQAPL